jgi:predicted dienelactone hydrolase
MQLLLPLENHLLEIIMLALLLACTTPNSDTAEEGLLFVNPGQVGEYGVVSIESSITSRDGLNLPLQLWFPSQSPSDSLHKYNDILSGSASESGSVDCSEKRPVVLFSHGNQGMRFQSFFLTEYLTSHGYIVLAPDHVGNTYADNDEDRKAELIIRRPHDLSDSFDWLLEQDDFQDCIDPDAGFAVMGHSFGGYTALSIAGAFVDTDLTAEFCDQFNAGWLCEDVAKIAEENGAGVYDQSDDRVWASVPMTPAALETLIGGVGTMTMPTLVFGGEYDTLTPINSVVKPIYESLTQENRNFAIIEKAGHYTFSNACDIVNAYPDCGDDHIALTEAHQLINTTITAFLENERGRPGLSEYLPVNDSRLIWE